jgi:hypothetical protein
MQSTIFSAIIITGGVQGCTGHAGEQGLELGHGIRFRVEMRSLRFKM